MNIETINAKIDELLALVKGWSEQEGATNIERDLALQKLSQLYDLIRFDDTARCEALPEQQEEKAETKEEYTSTDEKPTTVINVVDDSIFDINIDSVSLDDTEEVDEEQVVDEVQTVEEVQAVDEVQTVATQEANETTDTEVEVEAEVTSNTEEPAKEEKVATETPTERPKSQDNVLFDIDIVPKQNRSRRSALMSLYENDELHTKRSPRSQPKEKEAAMPTQVKITEPTLKMTESTEVPQIEEKKEEQPQVEPQQIDKTPNPTVADVIVPSVKTIAEQLAERHRPRPLNERVTYKSFNDLGINERYLLSRELFGDDPQRCRQVLTILEACQEYEDAMIFIAENFNWNEKSPGANVINAILENKFNI